VLLVTRIKPLGAAIEAIGKSSGPATPRNQHLEMSTDQDFTRIFSTESSDYETMNCLEQFPSARLHIV